MAQNILNQLTAWPLIAPVNIGPAPTPAQFSVAEARNGNERSIVLQIVTTQGVATYFLDPACAVELGRNLQTKGSDSGIQIVGAGMVPDLKRGS